ncbi:uncharacterized protein C8Q71DRAFT_859813 [Rhodofomes roseus]|uniref:Uncharacterized protein n=1 Tax=Rhodofomes roseus TaxID=34475 RepID=A0ABQ8KA76_9APHY|nr:uncharacterized protein C8Q71DRAFT_859813 [Rhodofomes roseus]KAH9834157.1 hypothetical protein C8Q71DRAFT_859813 [Rhodofomes roseus]
MSISTGSREYPQVPLTPPTRPLEWSDVNVIHTTDSDSDLSFLCGTAPQDYTLSRDFYPSNGSLLSLLISEVKSLTGSVS